MNNSHDTSVRTPPPQSFLRSSGSASILNETAIECPICCQVYENPKQLFCGHSLCASCVSHLAERRIPDGLGGAFDYGYGRAVYNDAPSVVCPICRTVTTIPSRGLPTNYSLSEIVSRVCDIKKTVKTCSNCSASITLDSQLCCETCDDGAEGLVGF
ncbi:hypothetical protein AB6A40_007667 [Gnathostoma spinigerum]|uniref:RING-type domain-containing protein n=1 Tax=Gnathostoma spinigerum TaxID=75299 RepID=A0ABD6EM57_9BILA